MKQTICPWLYIFIFNAFSSFSRGSHRWQGVRVQCQRHSQTKAFNFFQTIHLLCATFFNLVVAAMTISERSLAQPKAQREVSGCRALLSAMAIFRLSRIVKRASSK